MKKKLRKNVDTKYLSGYLEGIAMMDDVIGKHVYCVFKLKNTGRKYNELLEGFFKKNYASLTIKSTSNISNWLADIEKTLIDRILLKNKTNEDDINIKKYVSFHIIDRIESSFNGNKIIQCIKIEAELLGVEDQCIFYLLYIDYDVYVIQFC